jgi:nucleotide-binding universal stress UspA family protein
MLQTILVPLDGSPLAERALPYAVRLAKAGGGKLILLRAFDALRFTPPAQAEPDGQEQLESIAERARSEGVEVEAVAHQMYHEDVGQVIIETARERAAELLVMSTHGRGGLGRWIYGSVADAVLRGAAVPVLLVPAACEQPWPAERAPRIMVPLDGSDLAAEALAPAAELAGRLGAELVLVSVIQPPTYAYAEGYAYLALDPAEELAAAAGELEAIAERLRGDGLTVSVRTAAGFATTTIAELAHEAGIDLIVMATHGRGGLARLVLGSVATGTLQRAGLPVLLVRPAAMSHLAVEPASTAAPLAGAEPQAAAPAVEVNLSAAELDLLERGLGELLFAPEADRRLAEPARALLARLRQAEQELGAAAAQMAVVSQ